MPPSSATVKYENRDRVAWVTLNRPEALNAMNAELRNALGEAIIEATNDDDILVIVLTGEGGRAFSAGADLKEMAQRDASGASTDARQYSGGDEVENCHKPVIAAIDGFCLGGGLELTLRCDIRIATEQSRLGLPEPRRSITPPYGIHYLSRMIPLGDALLIHLTGGHVTPQRAYEIGLIQAVLPDRDALFAEAERLASEIKLCAPLAIQAAKQIVRKGRNLPVDESRKLAESLMQRVDDSEDRLEGPRAFAEKRAPVWKMR